MSNIMSSTMSNKLSNNGGYNPSIRLCDVERPLQGTCGFHLSRTQWDPYPWVSGVEGGSPAEVAGLTTGDCVLEVNGQDVLGQRICQVAAKVREKQHSVTLLLWNAGSDLHTARNIPGGGPTPLSIQRLSSCLQSVFQLLECPVCLEPVPPPASQCYNGHVLCARCRLRADKCPVCRVTLGPRGRCLLADKIHILLTTTFSGQQNQADLGKPRRQLETKFELQSKASSVENIANLVSNPIRSRSLSTGQIPQTKPEKTCAELLLNCPYGFECNVVTRSSKLLAHLQEDHEGPIVQYFLKSPSITLRLPWSKTSTILLSLTTQDRLVYYVKVMDRSLIWLWTVGDNTQASSRRFKVTAGNQGQAYLGDVFSLATPWHEIVRSKRCLHLPCQQPEEVTLEIVNVDICKTIQLKDN